MSTTATVLVFLAIFALAGFLLLVPRIFGGRDDHHDTPPPGTDGK
jgi:hypothetical protein